jgi:phage FluMu protein Com
MPISIVCSHCEKKLKVADTTAGKKIRCPACKGVITVPEAEEEFETPEKEEAIPDEDERDGGYGMDEKRDEEDEELKRKQRRKQKRLDREDRTRRRSSGQAHHGTTILLLGILSIVLSCIPIAAWYFGWRAINMANEDLDAMSAKRMDSSGRGMAQAGKACGMVGAFLGFVVLIVGIGSTISSIASK